ncbi:FmdB family zinc ribbon protein [Terriglobus sp.]|uniref:FmdB family zinc ribbon protein n=1 Tax=Terriglobus sp. TaxID=1889013 RepID=UPI003AFF8DB9
MPLYEYQCTACGKLTEKRQKFSDPELTECPHCGGRLERTITAPAVQFKGGGWYADLYSKGGKKPAANASPEGGGSGDAAKSGDSGSKSEGGSVASPATPSSTPSAASSSSTATPSPAKSS